MLMVLDDSYRKLTVLEGSYVNCMSLIVGSYEARSAPRYDVATRVEPGDPADLHQNVHHYISIKLYV